MRIKAIILAAGKGSRMRDGTQLPKVLREANGKPILSYLLSALDFIPPEDTTLVVGYMAESICSEFPAYQTALQEPQNGSGHAVQCALPLVTDASSVVVCYGDMPLISAETYMKVLSNHQRSGNTATLLAARLKESNAYGRVEIDKDGRFTRIVEAKDDPIFDERGKDFYLYNAGSYVFEASALESALKKLTNDNNQGEYYITDVPAIIAEDGGTVGVVIIDDGTEILGVNTPDDLRLVERILLERQNAD
ncbi:MAG: NTP transferase domain-containing protein [Oscillospiraceae bacterium]|jgi:bifunctional N-acetylglucosamine-1-phosphate-uridyltransferase/glucosamine-1-phosphate-acetyltransferase GlmU-like protein|nr:NTP transferase domain-containing protein [Oscillospiraceae bacterium]